MIQPMAHSPYEVFSRGEWAALRADTPLTLSEADLAGLRGQNEVISLREVEEIYLPLTRLINLYVTATQQLHQVSTSFLSSPTARVPYMIGLAGSVAVGKSTTARILQALLSRWKDHPSVALVTTDGFLYPNAELEARGLSWRKGFPESYDLQALIRFVSEIKSGKPHVEIPVYSHHDYDIIPGERQRIEQPDIMIVEGLNVLQTSAEANSPPPRVFISDYFDFTIYVHAEEEVIQEWYVERFLSFCEIARTDPTSFFRRFISLSDLKARQHAKKIWRDINKINLLENILPTRERARLILNKEHDHSVQSVQLRKL